MELVNEWRKIRWFNFRSFNLYVKEDDPLTLHRYPVAQSSDCIRGKVAYERGLHIFEITWSARQRGTNAVVGVATGTPDLTKEL